MTAGIERQVASRTTFLSRFRRQRLAIAGLIVIMLLVLIAILAPWVSPYDPNATNLMLSLKPPGTPGFLLGTDELGRDVVSRLIAGAQVSLLAALQGTSLTLAIGVPLGLIAGFNPGWIDKGIMFVTEVVMSFPAILLAIAIAGVLGPSLTNAMIGVGIVTAPRAIRLARASTLAIRQETYVEAARSIGAPGYQIIVRHILPNILAPLIVFTALFAGAVMLMEAGLSFIGVGVQPPQASWGSMLASGFNYAVIAPWLAIFPGILIALAVFSLNIIGDGARDSIGKKVIR